ncbi:DUF2975 domain-containing protein [Brevundimonas sp.]|uniref:DUF2975 domain-containing protein n=1 Tax=Brevundimonas sp. TaxID=1871086 RepID=UPI003AF9F8B7
MSFDDLARFRARCRQFQWLARFMVISVGSLLALMHLIVPVWLRLRGDEVPYAWDIVRSLIWAMPAVLYLAAVWMIGRALGHLSKGRLIQPTLVVALRNVGVALGVGGVWSVFVVTNLTRILQGGQGGWFHFDVSGMTLGMIGGALFLLGRVLDQAADVQAELDEMI